MSWFTRKPSNAARLPHARPLAGEDPFAAVFVCSTCGRTDLPEVGGWEPPICQECDAAINEDAMLEEQANEDA